MSSAYNDLYSSRSGVLEARLGRDLCLLLVLSRSPEIFNPPMPLTWRAVYTDLSLVLDLLGREEDA